MHPESRKRAHLLTSLAVGAIVSFAIAAWAQSNGSPALYFHHAALAGSGSLITASRVPVAMPDGKILLRDISIQFEADSNGNVTISDGYPRVLGSPELPMLQFQAGKYVGPRNVANGKAVIRVGGPSPSPGGGTTWSLLASDDADNCTYPSSATWYVGPLENSPQAPRLKRAGITSTAWSYGVSGVGPRSSCLPSGYFNWDNGSLIGVSQSGNTLTIATFTYSFSPVTGTDGQRTNDRNAPVDQITYILTQ